MFSFEDYGFENYVFVEEGSDGFIYGNYIDFDKFRAECEEEILLNAGFDIPFGKVISLEDFDNIFSNDSGLIDDDLLEYLKEEVFGGNLNSNNKVKAQFVERNTELAEELINNIFFNYEVPSGYEYEENLPDYLKYWYDPSDEQEYLDYINYPIELDEFDRQVKRNFDLLNNQKDEIIRKSIILASLIFAESLLKSVIIKGLPNDDGISSFYREIISEKIDKDLRYNNSRNVLFKKIYGEKLPVQSWIDLRNSLAHDIGKASIDGDAIKFYNMKYKKDDVYDIDQLKTDLIEFGNNLKGIINKN